MKSLQMTYSERDTGGTANLGEIAVKTIAWPNTHFHKMKISKFYV
jgi:hypothetical protein